MIPRFAALSIAEMTARTPSKLGISEERTCFCIVRRCVTTLRLRSERFNVWRVRLAADLVLAIDYKKLWTWTLAVAIAIVKGMAAQMCRRMDYSYARGLRAVTAPLFSTGGALSVGCAIDSRVVFVCSPRAWLFRRSAASAPPIRICSIVSEVEVELEPS